MWGQHHQLVGKGEQIGTGGGGGFDIAMVVEHKQLTQVDKLRCAGAVGAQVSQRQFAGRQVSHQQEH